MTSDTHSEPSAPARRRPRLYRTVLSLAIAAIVAAWLPFSVLYAEALNKRPAPIVITTTGGHRVVATRTSGGAPASQTQSIAVGQPTAAPAPVATRTS